MSNITIIGRHGTIVGMDDDRYEGDEVSVRWHDSVGKVTDTTMDFKTVRMKAGKHGSQFDLVEETNVM